jgi:hypothetical protein
VNDVGLRQLVNGGGLNNTVRNPNTITLINAIIKVLSRCAIFVFDWAQPQRDRWIEGRCAFGSTCWRAAE